MTATASGPEHQASIVMVGAFLLSLLYNLDFIVGMYLQLVPRVVAVMMMVYFPDMNSFLRDRLLFLRLCPSDLPYACLGQFNKKFKEHRSKNASVSIIPHFLPPFSGVEKAR